MFSFAKTGSSRKTGRIATIVRQTAPSFVRDRKGVAALEFAIIFPVLILFVAGTFEFGRALKARNEMSHALSMAVRVVDIDPDQTSGTVATAISDYLTGNGFDGLIVAVADTNVSGVDYMDITVSFPFELFVPFADVSTVTLDVSTMAPAIYSTQ